MAVVVAVVVAVMAALVVALVVAVVVVWVVLTPLDATLLTSSQESQAGGFR